MTSRNKIDKQITDNRHSESGNRGKGGLNRSRLKKNLTAALVRYCGLPEDSISFYDSSSDILEAIYKSFVRPIGRIFSCVPAAAIPELTSQHPIDLVDFYDISSQLVFDLEGMAKKIGEETDIIYLPFPDKYGGVNCSIEDIKFLLSHFERAKLVVDEEYFEFYGLTAKELISKFNNLIILRSFGPSLGESGLSCCYVLSNKDIQRQLNLANKNPGPTALSMIAAERSLDVPGSVKHQVSLIRENMVFLSTRFRVLGLKVLITPTDYLLINVAHPSRVTAFLKVYGLNVLDLSLCHNQINRIALKVTDDSSSLDAVKAFSEMPLQFYMTPEAGSKLTIRRHKELSADLQDNRSPEINNKYPELTKVTITDIG